MSAHTVAERKLSRLERPPRLTLDTQALSLEVSTSSTGLSNGSAWLNQPSSNCASSRPSPSRSLPL
jgi:hypothetical protein